MYPNPAPPLLYRRRRFIERRFIKRRFIVVLIIFLTADHSLWLLFTRNNIFHYICNWRKLEKKFAEGKVFLSVLPLANVTEEFCLSVRLFVWSLSCYRFHTCIMYTKLLMNRKYLAFNSSVKTLLCIMHLNTCTQLF